MAKHEPAATSAVYIFGSDKGGVGKSLSAQVAITAILSRTGKLPTIIEVEAEARLGAVYGSDNVHSFCLGAHTLEALESNPRLVYATWNKVGVLLLDAAKQGRDVVLDLGANLTQALMMWCNEFGSDGPMGAGEHVHFFAMSTGEAAALVSAGNALGYCAQALPASHRTLVINERDAALFPLSHDAQTVRQAAKAHGATTARLPRCLSAALAPIVDKRMRLDAALTKDATYWSEQGGLDEMEALLAARRLRTWSLNVMPLFTAQPATAEA